MTYGAAPYGAGSYAGTRAVPTTAGDTVVTDPANPSGSGWRFLNQGASGPYGGVAYGGGGILGQPAAGGLSAIPDPLLGIIRLNAWWGGAPYLRVARISGGVQTPVRGAYPVTVTTASRRNRCTNPSAELDTAGWLAGSNTTLSRITAAATPAGIGAFRLRATAAGSVNATVPVALPLPDGQPYVSFALMLSALPTGSLTLTATWRDSAGATLGTSTATITSAALASYVARWDRTPVLTLPLAAGAAGIAVASGVLTLAIAGMAANGTADLDAVLIEGGTSAGDYFDGTSQYAAWQGTAHASVSTLAAVQEILDREAPLDVPVSYELTAPDQPSSRITSEPVTLSSRDRTWLTHPLRDVAMIVTVTGEPEQTYPIAQGVFAVHGRRNPVVVSASVRGSAAATLTIATMRFADRAQLRDLLSDGAPLLLRHPARLGHGLGEWIAIADVAEAVDGHGGWERPRRFTLPYRVVDPPALPAAG